MNNTRSFERTLPKGYKAAFTVDAENKKTVTWFTIVSFVLTVLPVAASVAVIKPWTHMEQYTVWWCLAMAAGMVAYIVCHELVHGAAYKLLTHEKLTFGFTLAVAYCGVPEIFVYRRTALIALLAPFAFFTPVFLLPGLFAAAPAVRMLCMLLFSVHFGGCVGDLYDSWLYLTRFTEPTVLMQDNGPKQVFYTAE